MNDRYQALEQEKNNLEQYEEHNMAFHRGGLESGDMSQELDKFLGGENRFNQSDNKKS